MVMYSLKLCVKRLWCILLLIAFAAVPAFAWENTADAAEGRRKIRVAHYTVANYQEKDASGRLSGYSNDYLRKIAQIANWELEYVFVTMQDALVMLEEGRVDIVGFLGRNAEREARFAFPRFPAGVTSYTVATLKNTPLAGARGPESLNGCRVGLISGTEPARCFTEMAERQNIACEPVWRTTEAELIAALETGEADAAALSSFRDTSRWDAIHEYAHAPFYFATSKGNASVLEELEYALGEIETRYPAFAAKLADKYFPPWNFKTVSFTRQEKDFLESRPVLRVAYDPRWYPIEFYDKKNKSMGGVGRDILERIAQGTGLRFEFVNYSSPQEAIAAFQQGNCDIITGYSDDASFVDGNAFTEPYLYMPVAFIGNKKFLLEASNENITVALPEYYSGIPLILGRERPKYKIVFYQTAEECIQAVLNGDVTLTAESIYVAQHIILRKKQELAIVDTTVGNLPTQFIFAPHVSSLLVSVMDKSVAAISPAETENLFFRYAAMAYQKPGLSALEKDVLIGLGLACVAILLLSFFSWQLARKNAEVRTALQRAERASQTKTDFFKNLSHELRTPINAVMGLTETCISSIGDPRLVLGKLKKIYAASEHLLGLINNILDISKVESGKFFLCLSPELSRAKFDFLSEMFAPLCEQKNIRFHCLWDENIAPCFLTDKTKTDQILINILGNAVKFTPEYGTILFEVRLLERQDGKEKILFIVRDTGVGMTQDTLRAIFVPFSRAGVVMREKVEGTGLGMPLAQKLAEAMDGELSLYSEPGRGTEVRFSLWCAVCDSPLSPEPPAEGVSDLAGKRVLLVEDVVINQEIAAEMLRMGGIEVETAADGKEGSELFAASAPGYYDLIFMDIMMPVMDGYAATIAIRASAHPDAASVPIVAVTANAFSEDIEKALKSGMNGHIAKPFKAEELYAALRAFVRKT